MSRAADAIAAKIEYLFNTVRRPDGREYTYDEIERGTSGRVSRSYVWKLRNGRSHNPSLDVIESLAEFFHVPPEFFFGFDGDPEDQQSETAMVAALLHDPAARRLAEAARGLTPTAVRIVLGVIGALRPIEGMVAESPRAAASAAQERERFGDVGDPAS